MGARNGRHISAPKLLLVRFFVIFIEIHRSGIRFIIFRNIHAQLNDGVVGSYKRLLILDYENILSTVVS